MERTAGRMGRAALLAGALLAMAGCGDVKAGNSGGAGPDVLAFRADGRMAGTYDLFLSRGGETPEAVGDLVPGSSAWDPTWSPDRRFLAFLSSREAPMGSDLFVLDLATGALHNLTTGFAPDPISLRWSPDSTHIAFAVYLAATFVYDLYVVGLDLGPPELVTQAGTVADGQALQYGWQPTGVGASAWLAYTGDPEVMDRRDLYVVRADGGGHVRVNARGGAVSDMADVTAFSWAPDGSHLAYLYDPQPTARRLYSWAFGMEQEVSGLVGMDRSVDGYRWSPEGNRLAFLANKANAMAVDLHVVGESGGAVTPLTTLAAGQSVAFYDWTPDGGGLVYAAFTGSADPANHALRRIPATGGASTLIHPHSAINLTWSAVGGHLAFLADAYPPGDVNESVRVWVAPAAGLPFEATLGFPLDPMVDASVPRWSPTGQHLLFSVKAPMAMDSGLFRIAPAGGGPERVSPVGETPVVGTAVSYWSPSGRSVAWIVNDGTPLDGGPLRRWDPVNGVEDLLVDLQPAAEARAFAWR
jgi:Tol biopolymer transport system component